MTPPLFRWQMPLPWWIYSGPRRFSPYQTRGIGANTGIWHDLIVWAWNSGLLWLKMGEFSWRVFPEGCGVCESTPVFRLTNTHEPHCWNDTRLLAKSLKQHLPSSMPADDVPDSGNCWLHRRGMGTIPNVLIQCQIPYLGFDTASRTIFSFDTRCY